MLFGYDEQKEIFKKLADSGKLSHAYLLYGESQVGKFLFAKSLAHYLEQGIFDDILTALTETLIIDLSALAADDSISRESIGIDQVKELQHFLHQTPQKGEYRTAIIRDGEWLTDQAQNALLKILEEPPHYSLILITAADTSVFMPAISSRLQKVFFPILPKNTVLDFYNKSGIIQPRKGLDQSFGLAPENTGKIGFVLAAHQPSPQDQEATDLAVKVVRAATPQLKEVAVDEILAFADKGSGFLSLFLEKLLIVLHEHTLRYPDALGAVVEMMSNVQTLTLSRRIHLKDLLYKIR